jgi:A/G-specific adenine glycosylase
VPASAVSDRSAPSGGLPGPAGFRDTPVFRDPSAARASLLDWYVAHGRRLNFRTRRDPYAVLVSELMAQQTQISRVEPAWAAWLERFPSVEALAAAPTADVLRAWAGLGYNRRALDLQRAARMVVEVYGGRFPSSVEELWRLPGVGPYTARAVAAIAFGERVGAVDTNVRRVLGRVVGGWGGLDAATLQSVADDLVPEGRAGEWTHALMDVGARFCRPRRPACGDCPLRAWCAAAATPEPAGATRTATIASPPFHATTRWLRGRLVAAARSTPAPDGWVRVDEPVGPHDGPTAAAMARTLAAEGLLELHPTDAALARLPR